MLFSSFICSHNNGVVKRDPSAGCGSKRQKNSKMGLKNLGHTFPKSLFPFPAPSKHPGPGMILWLTQIP